MFKLNAITAGLTTIVDFADAGTGGNRGGFPLAGLANDGAGFLWGTTSGGGANNDGTVFVITGSSGALRTVVDFAPGTTGSNRGTNPYAALVSDGVGNMWGTTFHGGANSAGTLFKITGSSGALSTVVDFAATTSGSNRGGSPQAVLAQDGLGNLWGTTAAGGVYGYGTVFKINALTYALSTVVDFQNDGISKTGANPFAGLLNDGKGYLWGAASTGGADNFGTLFKVNASTGLLTPMTDFAGSTAGTSRGLFPYAALVSDGAGNFWGTTITGGSNGYGTVFEVTGSTGVLKTVIDFSGSSGANRGAKPYAALLSDGVGNLWGTTAYGGLYNYGTIFEISGKGTLQTVADFAATITGSNRGAVPQGALVSDGAGNLWGLTSLGGANSDGTVFKINQSTGALATLVDFSGNGGANRGATPQAALASDGAGSLWGTTMGGGVNHAGTVFKVDQTNGVLTTMVDFAGQVSGTNRGANPESALVSDGKGNFWGTTFGGGADGLGTIFEIKASTGALATTVDFSGPAGASRGANPEAALTSDGAGNLWGTTNGGGLNGVGTVFEVSATSGALTSAFDFTGSGGAFPGANPRGSLLLTGSGFYGTASTGGVTLTNGSANAGEVFLTSLSGFAPTFTVHNAVVTNMSVIFSATVNPNGWSGPSTNKSSVLVAWQIGLVAGGYTSKTSSQQVGTGTTPVLVSCSTSKGTPAIYHYQMVISERESRNYGPDQVFSVEPPAVTYSAPAASGTGAALSLTVNPNGLDTTVSLQYGLTNAYGGTISLGDIGSGFAPVALNPNLSGLVPYLAYHYRVVTTNALGTFFGPDQSFTTSPLFGTGVIVYTNQPAPGIPGATFASLGNPAINDLDHSAFQAQVSGSAITSLNNSGIWANSGTNGLTLIAQTGSSAFGYTAGTNAGTFGKLSDPVYTNKDSVAFLGTLAIAGTVTSANNVGVWATSSGTSPALLVARVGDPAPDPAGATSAASPVFASISQFVLPEQGGVVILASLLSGRGGVIPSNSQGIWGVDTDGFLKQIARSGDALMVNGIAKTISNVSIFNAPSASTGQTRHFNNPGDLTFKVTFTDHSSAIVQAVFP